MTGASARTGSPSSPWIASTSRHEATASAWNTKLRLRLFSRTTAASAEGSSDATAMRNAGPGPKTGTKAHTSAIAAPAPGRERDRRAACEQAEDDDARRQPCGHRQRDERDERGQSGRQEGPERVRGRPLEQRRHRFASDRGLAPAGLSAGRCTAGARR